MASNETTPAPVTTKDLKRVLTFKDLLLTSIGGIIGAGIMSIMGITIGMTGRSVVTTVINGVVKMKDRELIGIDKEAVLAHCREQSADLWNRINAGR